MEKVVEAKDDSLDTSEDPREDVEDRVKVESWSREETFWGRFSVAMFFPLFVWLNEKIDTQMERLLNIKNISFTSIIG